MACRELSRFGLLRRALAKRRAAARIRLRSPLRLWKGKLWHFRRESQSCAPVRQDSPPIGFGASLELGLGADSCDRFRVRCARILKKNYPRRALPRLPLAKPPQVEEKNARRGFGRLFGGPRNLGGKRKRATGAALIAPGGGADGGQERYGIGPRVRSRPQCEQFVRLRFAFFGRGVAIRRRAARERPSRGPRRGAPSGARRFWP